MELLPSGKPSRLGARAAAAQIATALELRRAIRRLRNHNFASTSERRVCARLFADEMRLDDRDGHRRISLLRWRSPPTLSNSPFWAIVEDGFVQLHSQPNRVATAWFLL